MKRNKNTGGVKRYDKINKYLPNYKIKIRLFNNTTICQTF